jgi:hypothetical protein
MPPHNNENKTATIKQSLLAQQCKQKAVTMDTVWLKNRSSEDIRSLGLVNDRLMMDYTPRCRCDVQADR